MSWGRRIEVSEFVASSAPDFSGPHVQRQSIRNWSRVLGLAGTLSLHGLAFQSFLLGSAHPRPRPPDVTGAGALHVQAAAAPSEELVLVTVADVQKDDADLAEQIASLGPQLQQSSLSILSSDPWPLLPIDTADQASQDSSRAAPEAGDPAVRALMFGRYAGQISARIERTWRRPRSPVSEPMPPLTGDTETLAAAREEIFRCQVQIRQDARGDVQEVLLLQCNGTETWRHSLVTAIIGSSPLPAPPTPTVFAAALTVTFEAHAYHPGSAPDEYEIEPREGVKRPAEVWPPARPPPL